MEYVLKGCVGAVVVVVIALLAKSRYAYLAGLAPLFPSFAILAQVFAYQQGGVETVNEVVIFGLLSLYPYVCYLLSMLFFVRHTTISVSIVASLMVWAVLAATQIYIWDEMGLGAYLMRR